MLSEDRLAYNAGPTSCESRFRAYPRHQRLCEKSVRIPSRFSRWRFSFSLTDDCDLKDTIAL
jgi:hypothetical protein